MYSESNNNTDTNNTDSSNQTSSNFNKNKTNTLNISSSDTALTANESLGKINFQPNISNTDIVPEQFISSTIESQSYAEPFIPIITGKWTYDHTGGALEKIWTTTENHGLSINDAITFTTVGQGASGSGDYNGYYRHEKYYVMSVPTLNTVRLSRTPIFTDTTNLVGWWKLDGNLNDSSRNSYNATNNGASTTTNHHGDSNKAYSFNGINDKLDLSSYPTLFTFAGGFTFSTWVLFKTINTNSSGLGYYPRLFDFTNSSGNMLILHGGASSDNESDLTFTHMNNGSSYNVTTTSNPQVLNTWMHITLTVNNSSRNVIIYKNGVSILDTTIGGSYVEEARDISFIGNNNAGDRGLHGDMADIRIYNTVLSPTDIMKIYRETPIDGNADSSGIWYAEKRIVGSLSYDHTGGSSEKLWTNTEAHGLSINDSVVFVTDGIGGAEGYQKDKLYYLKTRPSDTTFTLSESVAGTIVDGKSDSDSSSNLVGWWKMDGNVNDSSGNNNHGTLGDGSTSSTYPTLTSGYSGIANQAYDFDGGDNIRFSTFPSQIPTGSSAFTTSVWINPDVHNGADAIIGWGNLTNNQSNVIRLNGTGGLYHYFFNNDLSITTGSLVGKWTHVVLTFDGTTRTFYINGVVPSSGSNTPTGVNVQGQNLRIGSRPDNGEYFNGQIADVRIYDTALTANQVSDIFNETKIWHLAKNVVKSSLVFKTNDSNKNQERLKIDNNVESTGDISIDEPQYQEDLFSDLVGWWKMDGNLNDSKFNDNGTATGTTFTGDRYGNGNKAYLFDGVNDYITFTGAAKSSSPIFKLSESNFSISCWFKTITNQGSPLEQTIVSKAYDGSDKDFMIWLNSGKLEFHTEIGSNNHKYSTDDSVPLNRWNHVVASISVSSLQMTVRLYLNGKLLSGTYNDNPSDRYLTTHDNFSKHKVNLYIGSTYYIGGSASYFFKGSISDVRIYNKVLSHPEVYNLYKPGGTLTLDKIIKYKDKPLEYYIPDLPVGHWKFDGDANDSSGNGINGILGDGSTTLTYPTLTQGYDGTINGAYSFDGSNDYIRIPYNSVLDMSSNNTLTISVWILGTDWSSDYQTIFAAFNSVSSDITSYRLMVEDNTGKPYIVLSTGTIISPDPLSENTWYHIVVTCDGSTQKLYVNNVLKVSSSQPAFNSLSTETNAIIIGASLGGSGDNFKGSIDDVRIYNYDLTPEQVEKLYLINSQTYLDKGIKVTDYGRVEIEGSLHVKQTVPVTNQARPVMVFPSKIEQVSSTGNNWISLENVMSGIMIKMVGAGGGGGGPGDTDTQGDTGGGGGSGSYAEAYITKDELDKQGATHIYLSIGSGGAGGTGTGDGSNGGSSQCKIAKNNTDTSGSTIFTIFPGNKGVHGNAWGSPGDGGAKGEISIGSGYCLKGNPGETGENADGDYQHNAGSLGGYSPLGSCGIGPTHVTTSINGTNGGGGGGGVIRYSGVPVSGSAGGNAFALVYIC